MGYGREGVDYLFFRSLFVCLFVFSQRDGPHDNCTQHLVLSCPLKIQLRDSHRSANSLRGNKPLPHFSIFNYGRRNARTFLKPLERWPWTNMIHRDCWTTLPHSPLMWECLAHSPSTPEYLKLQPISPTSQVQAHPVLALGRASVRYALGWLRGDPLVRSHLGLAHWFFDYRKPYPIKTRPSRCLHWAQYPKVCFDW